MFSTEDQEQNPKKSGLRFSADISLGQIMQVGAIIIAVVVWATTASGKADQAAQGVNEVKNQIAGLQSQIDRGLQSLQQQISNIPGYGARIDQLEKGQAQQGSNINQLDNRLRSVENQTAIDNSRLDNIERASSLPLRGERQNIR